MPEGQRHLDEDQRLIRQRRMKERVTAAVRFEPASQIAPALDLMNRLVLDQPLEHQRGRAPLDSLQHQEAAIEPGAEQVREVGIDAARSDARQCRQQSRRMPTSTAVARAMLKRRNSSWRGDSTSSCRRTRFAWMDRVVRVCGAAPPRRNREKLGAQQVEERLARGLSSSS